MEYKCTHCYKHNVEPLGFTNDGEEICSNCGEIDDSGELRHKSGYVSTSFVSHNKNLKKDDKDNSSNS